MGFSKETSTVQDSENKESIYLPLYRSLSR